MDDDRDLRTFSGRCRLFPLPGVVLFPHVVLALHIFEPRYRQMTADALADDNLITIVQLLPTSPGTGSPPIEEVGCLGRIIQHEPLPDGRYNFLLLGRKRVRLRREVASEKLYRIAEAEILEDAEDGVGEAPARQELIALFRRAFERQHEPDPDITAILETSIPLSVLTDIVAHALGLPAESKQRLLAEPRPGRRADGLIAVLKQILARPGGALAGREGFPPPFSVN